MKGKKYHSLWVWQSYSSLKEFGLLRLIWGTDIWIQGVPTVKCMIGANILVWILLFVLGR
ncbi:unnamed protein product [marine sediment metagenome]|uniref:Uncharacterized protein n=1 Tax=marine sediment metagenome TaxID=412755 RepID=X0YVC5_9ZZZZ